ncbi:hypothetical protein DFH05DRAFT_563134 [Lentinula detonsa]|uniref:CHY-type domain-containing protein n=1 Tax=Lentinula detonsa TaxID=2804962 RepID=A0A9W8P792_9AGAR|nr:hypothetical protein DFH05DRAFT_563134 [Lentinula detonsa]
MCKHILNVQVSIRAPCCKEWYDCVECHAEKQTHKLIKTMEMAFLCKKCKKAFYKDMEKYEESDEFCPYCDNHYVSSAFNQHLSPSTSTNQQVIEAKTPQAVVGFEGEDARIDARMLKDERIKPQNNHTVFTMDPDEEAALLDF